MGENPAALRAAVFSLSSKNLRGAFKRPPPPAGRGLTRRRVGAAQMDDLRLLPASLHRYKLIELCQAYAYLPYDT